MEKPESYQSPERLPIPKRPQPRFSLLSVVMVAVVALVGGFVLADNIEGLILGTRLQSQNQQLPEDLNYESVEALYDLLRQNFAGELSETELLKGLKSGLVAASGDPFTEYLTAEEAEALQSSLEGEFSGIGAEIGIQDEQLVVIAPLKGTPAEQAGLRAQDLIIAIDGEDAQALSVSEAVAKIRGEAGTKVTLSILRANERTAREIAITRSNIEIPSVETELLEDNIGYLRLVQFGTDTVADFRASAKNLKRRGARQIILDVRDNPGGYLDAAVDISSEFLPAGTLVVEERRDEEVVGRELASAGGVLVDLPVVVLINGGSASASEIVAGALRDEDGARLVGVQSFGKGSVQQLLELPGQDLLRVTIANWYTPNGRNISEEGIVPDVTVELSDEDRASERDPQRQRAIEILKR